MGLITGITGPAAVSNGRADTFGLLFSIISAGRTRFRRTGVILTVAGRSGDLILSRAVGRRIDVFGRANTSFLAGHTGDGMNHAGRKLGRGASRIKIIMFHTIGIVFDNISAANIFRTAGTLAALPVREPPGGGK